MNDQNEGRPDRGFVWGVMLIFVLPVLYAVSIGPAAWFLLKIDPAQDGPLTMVFAVFYTPLQYAYEFAGEPQWFEAYVELWID